MTYPLKMRLHILEIKQKEGLTIDETYQRFNIGRTSLVRWLLSVEPKPKRDRPAIKINMESLRQDVIDRPDDFQYERAQRFGVSRFAIHAALKRLGVTRKKNFAAPEGKARKQNYVFE